MILPLATVLALAATCAPVVAPETIAKIAQTESRLDPLAIHDNSTGQSYAPASRDEAVGIAAKLISAGHSVDNGLMQITSGNLEWLSLSLEDAFDPCASIRAGAEVLTSLSRYNTGSSSSAVGMRYAVRVLSQGKGEPQGPGPTKPEVKVEPKPHWRMFGDNKGIFSTASEDMK